jgi:hypothetical protein
MLGLLGLLRCVYTGEDRIDQFSPGYFRLENVMSGYVRLGDVKLGYVRLYKFRTI